MRGYVFALCVAARLACALPLYSLQNLEPIGNGLRKLSGVDAPSGITYTRVMLDGTLVVPGSPADSPALAIDGLPPRLTAQCSRDAAGKSAFEFFYNYGGIEDVSFHRPWRRKDQDDLFPPRTEKTAVMMDFFGYTHVKPVKRQWELVIEPFGELRYNQPTFGSSNMENISFYLRYLLALPVLRLTHDGKAAQFLTTPLLEAVRSEPLCKASGL